MWPIIPWLITAWVFLTYEPANITLEDVTYYEVTIVESKCTQRRSLGNIYFTVQRNGQITDEVFYSSTSCDSFDLELFVNQSAKIGKYNDRLVSCVIGDQVLLTAEQGVKTYNRGIHTPVTYPLTIAIFFTLIYFWHLYANQKKFGVKLK